MIPNCTFQILIADNRLTLYVSQFLAIWIWNVQLGIIDLYYSLFVLTCNTSFQYLFVSHNFMPKNYTGGGSMNVTDGLSEQGH